MTRPLTPHLVRYLLLFGIICSSSQCVAQSCTSAPPCGASIDTLNGVVAHSNACSFMVGCYDHNVEWECLEFVERYYGSYMETNIGPFGLAYRVFSILKADPRFEAHAQGDVVIPQGDDIIVFNRTAGDPAGHVAIAKSDPVLQPDGSYQISIIEQNVYLTHELALQGDSTHGFNITGRPGFSGGLPVLGWIRKVGSTHRGTPPVASFMMSSIGYSSVLSTNGSVGAANILSIFTASGQVPIINFDATGSTGSGSLAYTWTSDGNVFPPTAPCTGPTCQFGIGAAGSPHQIKLVVTDSYGQSSQAFAQVVVTVINPTGMLAAGATLDTPGNAWTSSSTFPISYTITDSNNNPVPGTTGLPFSVSGLTPGSYTLSFTSGGPSNAMLTGILPCGVLTRGPTCSSTLAAGQTLTFTLQFTSNPPTAGFSMSSG
ncbi:MAG: carboxypeptidase-like regulatory domain-containing protein, partial [Candidatus Solibacter sp.]